MLRWGYFSCTLTSGWICGGFIRRRQRERLLSLIFMFSSTRVKRTGSQEQHLPVIPGHSAQHFSFCHAIKIWCTFSRRSQPMHVERGITSKASAIYHRRCPVQHIIGATTSPFPTSIFPRKGQEAPAKSREAPLGTAVAPAPQNPSTAFSTTTGCLKMKHC